MAHRPVFLAGTSGSPPWVTGIDVTFDWFPGLALSQKQQSIRSLHEAAQSKGIGPLLEVSSKSQETLGVRLSAFNLLLALDDGRRTPIECAFQAGKVFEEAGPFPELLNASPLEAKGDTRLRTSGSLVAFEFLGRRFPLIPETFFYDWLYLQALTQHPDLIEGLRRYVGFTDIEFNPNRKAYTPINCQARSCALAVALLAAGHGLADMADPDDFAAVLEQPAHEVSEEPQTLF